MKECPTLVIKEMSIKTFFQLAQQISKNCVKQNIGDDVGRLVFLCTVRGNVSWLNIFGSHFAIKIYNIYSFAKQFQFSEFILQI